MTFERNLATNRNTQLDGLRAFAVLGVMWHHWTPAAWRGPFPFEIGLFFFLTLTGFLITRILLKDRAVGEASGDRWRGRAYWEFQKRRLSRILIPCYAAMFFALALQAPDIRENALAYFGHWSNFHMAYRENWPDGTAHYWTLAVQIQFYLFWPLVVFGAPRKWLPVAFLVAVAVAPISRVVLGRYFPEIFHSEAIPSSSLDYFAVGALLALAMQRGLTPGNAVVNRVAWVAFAGYLVLYVGNQMAWPLAGFDCIQQTLLSIAFAGLISATLAGFHGWRARLLDHPAAQHIGRLSFGLYLFHTPVPMFVGFILPHLWFPFFTGPWVAVRLVAFALTAWGLAFLCWKYLEKGSVRADARVPADPQGQ